MNPFSYLSLDSGTLGSIFHAIQPFLVDGLKHVFYVDDRVSELEEFMDSLNAARNDVQRSIETGERAMQEPTVGVENWLQRVTAIESEVASIKQMHEERMRCLGGLYLDCWSKFRIGSRAAEKLRKVQELKTEGSAFAAATVDAPPRAGMQPMSAIVEGDSVRSILHEVSDYLDDNSTSGEIAGIWGPGGIGKTTILKKINNSLQGDSRFDLVLFVVASKECTTQKIQHSIVGQLKLRKEDDVEEQARTIHHFLCNKKFVLLLDDVWEYVDLEEVGLPASRKVVLTTRFDAVCGDMQAHRRIKVGFLSLEDARSLFLKNVGEAILNRDPSILGIAEVVIAECGGLPLALVTIGKVMSSKRNYEEWLLVVKELRKNQFPPGTDQNLFSKLKLSFDSLKVDRERECFLCCALWPEDYNIKKEDLINCWMGHGHLDDSSDIYLKGYTIIGNLLASCLLEPAGEGDHGEAVKMHDVVRNMALWIVSQRGDKWVVRAGLGLTGEAASLGRLDWHGAQKISLAYNEMKSLPSWLGRDSKKLNTLMLQSNRLLMSSTNLPSWTYYNELKYLDLSNNIRHCGFLIFSLDVFECMKNLEYLNLSGLYSIIHLDELPPFPNLKYLLLRNNKVTAQKQSSIPPKLLILDVFNEYCKEVEQGMIIDGLYHHNQDGHNKWLSLVGVHVHSVEEFRKASTLNIRSLIINEIKGQSFLNLADPDVLGNDYFKYGLRELWISKCYDLVELLVSVTLTSLWSLQLECLGSLEKMIFKGLATTDFFPRLRHINIESCNQLSHASWVLLLPCLEELILHGCHKMEYVIIGSQVKMELDREKRNIAFPRLKGLRLWDLPALVGVCDYTLTSVPPLLERFKVFGDCSKLRTFPFMRVATASTMDGASSSSSKESRHAATTRSKLQIDGPQKWWDDLIWDVDDEDSRVYFQQFFKPYR